MDEIAIRVQSVSKQYAIGRKQQETYKTLRESISRLLASPFRRVNKLWRKHHDGIPTQDETIWALRDVSFEIKRGEVVGLIGPNGAGKSTLLKILSRITEPSVGFAETRGRVTSLLEVGTGFHDELTGRENIYLNGALLGMRRSEIDHNFEGIVAFAEVQKFIDTPVKHYSSGMYLRLAFAVAAHLQPDILIVDEVLAVGDAAFQRKCLSKMEEVSRDGRTVLVVSHNIPTIVRLCERVILLDSGNVLQDGPAQQVVTSYLSSGLAVTSSREWHDPKKAPGNDIVRMCAVRLKTEQNGVTDSVDIREPFGIELEYEVLKPGHVLVASFGLVNEEEVCIFVTSDHDLPWWRCPRPVGRFVSRVMIPGSFLSPGIVKVGAGVVTEDPFVIHFDEYPAIIFKVTDLPGGNSSEEDKGCYASGIINPMLKWITRFTPTLAP